MLAVVTVTPRLEPRWLVHLALILRSKRLLRRCRVDLFADGEFVTSHPLGDLAEV